MLLVRPEGLAPFIAQNAAWVDPSVTHPGVPGVVTSIRTRPTIRRPSGAMDGRPFPSTAHVPSARALIRRRADAAIDARPGLIAIRA